MKASIRYILFIFLLFQLNHVVAAEREYRIVRDMTPFWSSSESSNITRSVTVNEEIYFLKEDHTNFLTTLYRTKGTRNETNEIYRWHSYYPAEYGARSITVDREGNFLFALTNRDYQTKLIKFNPKTKTSVTMLEVGANFYLPNTLRFYYGDGYVIFFGAKRSSGDSSLTTIWRTDGTNEGTYELKDSATGNRILYPSTMMRKDGGFVFFAKGKTGARAIYTTDGSYQGTHYVKEVDDALSLGLMTDGETSVNGQYFFQGYKSFHAFDINSFEFKALPTNAFCDVTYEKYWTDNCLITGERIYFYSATEESSSSLWSTDGSVAGTHKEFDVDGAIKLVRRYQNTLVVRTEFANSSVKWYSFDMISRTAKTLSTTILADNYRIQNSNEMTNHGLLISGLDMQTSRSALVLLDPINDKVVPLKNSETYVSPTNVLVLGTLGNNFIFMFSDKNTGLEPWTSAGSENTTHLIKDLSYYGVSSEATPIAAHDGKILFAAHSVPAEPGLDIDPKEKKLWLTDGTATGTRAIAGAVEWLAWGEDINAVYENSHGVFFVPTSYSGGVVAYFDWATEKVTPLAHASFDLVNGNGSAVLWKDELVFITSNSVGYSLWRSNGTADGTKEIAFFGTTHIGSLVADEAFIYFTYGQFHGVVISDGTEAGTGTFAAFPDYEQLSSSAHQMFMSSHYIYAFAGTTNADYRYALYRVDTRTGEVTTIKMLNEASALGEVNGDVCFVTKVALSDPFGLWCVNGTTTSTRYLSEVPGSLMLAKDVFLKNGSQYYFSIEASMENTLWRTDGTNAGTMKVSNMDSYDFSPISLCDGTIFYSNWLRHSFDVELWSITNDRTEGQEVFDIQPGGQGSAPSRVLCVNNQIVFAARTGTYGRELLKGGEFSSTDADQDGFDDLIDAFPHYELEWLDFDNDGLGDNEDVDDDNDGHNDRDDLYPNDGSRWSDPPPTNDNEPAEPGTGSSGGGGGSVDLATLLGLLLCWLMVSRKLVSRRTSAG